MSDHARFFLSCIPPTTTHQAKNIVRIPVRGGRSFSKLVDKPELREAKTTLVSLLLPHAIASPLTGPYVLSVVFTWPWRSGTPKRDLAKGRVPHTSRPDGSNLVKTLEDLLVQLKFIEDDNAVAELHVQKWWGDTPGIEIDIRTVAHVPRQVHEQDLFTSLLEANA